jgi:hypothetical protein
MTSKRTGTRKRSSKRVKARAAFRVFGRRAQAEVARLLRRNRAGTITQRELQTGLREIKEDMRRMLVFKRALL